MLLWELLEVASYQSHKMLTNANLKKTGQRWEFENEAALEDFVWTNLEQLLKLTPLKRQYTVRGQICDILAMAKNRRLVVLELKNTEDRYIVQQLTRYYDVLFEEKPFNDKIDYEESIDMVAVAPSFHRDNYTDRKYNHLSIQFLQIEILTIGEKLYLQLKDVDAEENTQVEILSYQSNSTVDLPSPPRALLNLLSKFADGDSKLLLKIRQKILSFDERMQETSASGIISYGKGKSHLCAELYGKKEARCKSEDLLRPFMVLWLPTSPYRSDCKRLGRMTIYRQAFDKNPCLSYIDWYSRIDYKPKSSRSHSANQSWNVEHYIHLYLKREGNESYLNNSDYLEFLVELALSEWLKRL